MNILQSSEIMSNTTSYMAFGVSHIFSIQALRDSGQQADWKDFQFFHTVNSIVNPIVNI